ncbi:MAG: c-type cytochrome domain-containing protein, partial [Limisphaerales bacterium]
MPFKFRCAFSVTLSVAAGSASAAAAKVDFSHQIVPILREHCGECHTGDKKKGSFSMNDRASLIAGGESGKAVLPGNAARSPLIEAITSKDPDKQMPPKGARLSPEKVKLLRDWIDAGGEALAVRRVGDEFAGELVVRFVVRERAVEPLGDLLPATGDEAR